MIYSVQQIKFEILAYIKEFDTDFSNWYIGISSTPKVVMREAHGVDEAHDAWFCKQAVSFRACETIRSYFTEKLKVDGTRITGTADDGNWVYLFRKSSRTRPEVIQPGGMRQSVRSVGEGAGQD
jgi:hypothetical protein